MISYELKKRESVNIKIFKYICKIKYQIIMRAKTKIIVIIALALGCVMGASAKRVNMKRLEVRLDSLLQAHYDPQSPGAALLIAKNGKAIYDKGIGSSRR